VARRGARARSPRLTPCSRFRGHGGGARTLVIGGQGTDAPLVQQRGDLSPPSSIFISRVFFLHPARTVATVLYSTRRVYSTVQYCTGLPGTVHTVLYSILALCLWGFRKPLLLRGPVQISSKIKIIPRLNVDFSSLYLRLR
jgi:hypothetical protein